MASGKSYIGSSADVRCRIKEHFRDLRKGEHHSICLQRAYNKYGEQNLGIKMLKYVDIKTQLIIEEQKYFNILKPEYNISPVAGSSLGCKMSHIDNLKNSERNSGFGNGNAKIKNISQVEKIVSLRNSGKTLKQIASFLNVNWSTIQRLLNGKTKTNNATKEIIKDSFKGKNYSWEGRQRIIDSRRGVSNSGKPILCRDKNGTIIDTFKTITSASKKLGIGLSSVCVCCKGRQLTAGGYIFEYL